MTDYYDLTLDDGISGDDVNRHLREKNLGYLPPSADWLDSGREIRCIYEGQTITTKPLVPGTDLRVHAKLAYWNPDNMLTEKIRIVD